MSFWNFLCMGWLFNKNEFSSNSCQELNNLGFLDFPSSHCLDLNHNGICDYLETTTDCWDLNGNGINDMFEDTSYSWDSCDDSYWND